MTGTGWTRRTPLVILVVGLLLSVLAAFACWLLYNQTEDRLLHQKVSEAGSALSVSVGTVRAPLNAAATLAMVTEGDPHSYETVMTPYVGPETPPATYSSVSLYRVGDEQPVVHIGSDSVLPTEGPDGVASVMQRTTAAPFVVVDLLAHDRHLGYAVADSQSSANYIVYGERTLNPDPHVRQRQDEPFSQVDYAIYLGDKPTDEKLIQSSVNDVPLGGRTASTKIPFGDTTLLLVMTPIGSLTSPAFAWLWLIALVAGAGASIAAAFTARRLTERRDNALALAQENERLYDEQRAIAETLQLSLLPQQFSTPEGVEIAARYWPAGSANLIGGDFYDVFRVDDDRWGITIGDVCGKGIEAAALTGLVRHTVRAAARTTDSPSEVLRAVHVALGDLDPPTFCTACFMYIDSSDGERRVSLALGGHPQPLLRRADGFVTTVGEVGTLLGMVEPHLSDSAVVVSPADTLVMYTDGLTDAPIEQAVPIEEVEEVLERLGGIQPVEQLADSIRVLKRRRRPRGSADDTALLVVRFGNLPARLPDEAPVVGSTSVLPG